MPIGPDSRASAAQISQVPYLPGLDGMRALAVMAVMVYHAHQWLGAGFLGVEVFFVISGYLITLLLISEHERDGRISLRQFWLRRFRRLLPALYVTLVLVGLYCLIWEPRALGKLRGDMVGAITYSTNWYQIWSGQGYTGQFDFVPLRHLWSLAVEEQFYLVWPLVMLVLLRRGRSRLPKLGVRLFALSLAISIATAVMFHSGSSAECAVEGGSLGPPCTFNFFGRALETNNFLYLGTISRSSGILLGAAFAMLWRPKAIMRGPLRRKARLLDLFGLGGLALIGFLCFRFELYTSFTAKWYGPIFRGGLLLTGLATLCVIAAVTHPRSLIGKFLANPVLNWIGTRSYGLYLFHWPIYEFIRKQAGLKLTLPQLGLALVLTGCVAEASYRYVETPIRRGRLSDWWADRRRLSPERRRRSIVIVSVVGFVLGVLGVSIATAKVKCTNDIECSFVEAQSPETEVPTIPDASSSSTSTLPGAPGVIDPTSTTTVAAAPGITVPGDTTTTVAETTTVPTTSPTQKIPILAVGDSVMVGAANKLSSAGIYVDAAESRQAKIGADILEATAAKGILGDYIVIQMGTNGPMSDETLGRMMAATANAKVVVVLTVKAPKNWIGPNNDKIRALPATHPNVIVVDWEQIAGATPGILYGDGIHLKGAEGTKFYANLILAALGRGQIP